MRRVGEFVRQHKLEFISFVTGFALLTFELAAARVLAPSIGSSTYVWTSVIGIIIAALSLGFFAGGKVADNRNRASDLVWLLFLAAATTVGTLLAYQGVLQAIVESIDDSRVQAVVAALTLFAPTSFFIGMTSPYLAKLNVSSLKSTGQNIASLDMFNAIGGITGTFVTGFVLFGYIGSHQAIGLVALLLVLASWLILPRRRLLHRLIISGVLLLLALLPPAVTAGVTKIETASAHYEVINGFIGTRAAVGLVTGPNGTQSAVYTDDPAEPVFWYLREAARLTVGQQPKSVLVLGGGAFTLPQYLSEKLPNAHIDVVEIDPKLKDISQDYFNYKNPSNVTETFMDGRVFVNQATKQYDVVVVDVYGDTAIPFGFMTKEYGQAIAKILSPRGIVIANIIGGLKGECRDAFAAVDAAYRTALPYAVYSNESEQVEARANHIVVYAKQPVHLSGVQPLVSFQQTPYTDNFAPAERLYFQCAEAN